MYLSLSIIAIWCLNLFAPKTTSPNIQLLDIEVLDQDNYHHYLYPKKKFASFFEEDFTVNFPEQIKVFEHQPPSEQRAELFDCEMAVRDIKAKYTEYCKKRQKEESTEGFKKYWEKGLRLCHKKYLEAAPVVNFKFHNIGSKTIVCDSVFVLVYAVSASYASEFQFLPFPADDPQNLLVDPCLLHTDQARVLAKPIITDKPVFSIPLRLLSERHWSGDFEKDKFTMEIKFSFVDNQTGARQYLRSIPFTIDI